MSRSKNDLVNLLETKLNINTANMTQKWYEEIKRTIPNISNQEAMDMAIQETEAIEMNARAAVDAAKEALKKGRKAEQDLSRLVKNLRI